MYLQEGKIRVFSKQDCSKYYQETYGLDVPDVWMCAGYRTGGIDSCGVSVVRSQKRVLFIENGVQNAMEKYNYVGRQTLIQYQVVLHETHYVVDVHTQTRKTV